MTKHTGLLSARAECRDCNRQIGSERNGAGVAARHARATGHEVSVEQTISIVYNLREKQ